MRIPFTKMQGAGNDFVVLDETRHRLQLSPAQIRWLADRHLGVGADQILRVQPATRADVDFSYVIHNADGGEVEHCGNGARCFMNFVRAKGLTSKDRVRVQTVNRLLELVAQPDGRVTVDMEAPDLRPPSLPFDPLGLQPQTVGQAQVWPLALADGSQVQAALVSMGNPHAVLRVADAARAPVATLGPAVQALPHFPNGVNVGFVQVQDAHTVVLRVYERGAGETLACGTGACAAVVAGRLQGWLDARVDVHTRGGLLTIEWAGGDAPVLLTGPAVLVFDGVVEIPESI